MTGKFSLKLKRTREMRFAQKYLEIVRKRGERQAPLQRIYKNLRNQELFLLAYGKLYSNKGALTKGVNPNDTVDGMSLKRIKIILQKLKRGHYRWKATRRTLIPKRDNKKKKRPLGLPVWSDKLVAEVIRMILEAYYEPRFRVSSHGFRPNKGCHTALLWIYEKWTGIKWFIEGDIRGCFDNINHDVLVRILSRDIEDKRFLKLIKGMLKAGYLEDWKHHKTYSGTPQGGILSPLLSNIVLHELDNYVEDVLIPRYSQQGNRRRKANPKYQYLSNQMKLAKRNKDKKHYNTLFKARMQVPSYSPTDPDFRRLRYVRYADDFLLGFIGSKSEAKQIKRELMEFLRKLKLELSEEKTYITHATTEEAKFLGYNISVIYDNSKVAERTGDGRKTRSGNGKIRLSIPGDVIYKWRKKVTKKNKISHRAELSYQSDYDIIRTYEVELQGLINYYTMAHDVRKCNYLRHLYWMSLLKTLANKHKTRIAKIYKKYTMHLLDGRKVIGVKVERKDKEPLIAMFGKKRIHQDRNVILKDDVVTIFTKPSEIIKRLLSNTCELCKSNELIEVHHIRKLKDLKRRYLNRKKTPPGWVRKMISLSRKTLIVCKDCHNKIHNGKYDGVNLSKGLLASCVR